MKRVLTLFLAAVLVLSASGCGIKRKIEDKIGEKVFEEITDGNVDVEDDEITIKGEDGSEFSFGGTEWPEHELMKDIPKFDKGTIGSVSTSDVIIMIMVEGVEREDYDSYCEKIKEDFTVDPVEMTLDNLITFAASNDKGVYVQVSYNIDESNFYLNVSKADQ